MKYSFDTEFLQDGSGCIELVSIGIVAEDGRTYYAESSEFDESKANAFVKEQVLPKLGPPSDRKMLEQIKAEIVEFVGEDEAPVFIAYYNSYDWVLFTELFGVFGNMPKGWPKFCWDLKQLQLMAGVELLAKHTTGAHNALADAQWTMDAFKDLEAKGHGIPATVVGEKGRLSPAAPKPAQEATEAPRGQQTGIFAFYGEIRSSVLGLTPEMLAQSPFGEAIGDNTTDNLVDALRSATAVEVGQFVVGLLSVNAEKFAYAFEQAHYDGFKDALGMLVQRFRLMDGSEQTDLFTKIVLMFKDLMITKYADLGTDAAETVAAKFAAMMIDFLKSEAIQAADLSTDHTGKYY